MSVRGCACTIGSHPSPAWWQSGHAADCKSAYAGSIPTQASSISRQPASAGFLLEARAGIACRRHRVLSGRWRNGMPPAPHPASPPDGASAEAPLTALSDRPISQGRAADAARRQRLHAIRWPLRSDRARSRLRLSTSRPSPGDRGVAGVRAFPAWAPEQRNGIRCYRRRARRRARRVSLIVSKPAFSSGIANVSTKFCP